VWRFEPERAGRPAPTGMGDVPAKTDASTALSKELLRRGFRFVGPTTCYAAMQALGLVNDHLAGCWVRDGCEEQRARVAVPPAR
jgi:DNA-3-methyladenine glycosylase I